MSGARVGKKLLHERCVQEGRAAARGLVEFVEKCPSMFHTAAELGRRLEAAGFERLRENEPWEIGAGGKYYVTRNNSSVAAFSVGERVEAADLRFQLCAAHGDSPSLKVKAGPELCGPADYTRLNVEVYGGPIDHSWLDRPLGVAGRVMVRKDGDAGAGARVVSRLYDSGRDVALIPNVAIHLNREAGRSPELNRAVDLPALFSAGELGRAASTRWSPRTWAWIRSRSSRATCSCITALRRGCGALPTSS